MWVATQDGLNRYDGNTVVTYKHDPNDAGSLSVLAATDGSIWIAAENGLTRWKNGRATVFGTTSGLPHHRTQSLFQDDRGRIWVFTDGGLAYLTNDDRFAAVPGVHSNEVSSICSTSLTNTTELRRAGHRIDTATAARVTSTPTQFRFGVKFNF